MIVGGRYIYNARYDDMIKFHNDSRADITLMYNRFDPFTYDYSLSSGSTRAFVKTDEAGVVTDMELNPNVITCPNALMDVILIKRTLLMHLIDNAAARGYHELYRDVIMESLGEGGLRIMGYEFKGYCRRMETIKSYYNMNMDLLKAKVRKELFGTNPVYTKTRDDAPAKYLPGAEVKNSLVADGCVIEGTVENSVLFRGVHVGKGAHIKGAIIMQDCDIGKDVELENVILDKDVTMLPGGRLIGHKQYPIVMGKNVTL